MSSKYIKVKRIAVPMLTALLLSTNTLSAMSNSEIAKALTLEPLQIEVYAATPTTFKDVDTNAWYYNDVSYLTSKGGIKGYEDGTFRPQNSITKMEFLKTAICSVLSEEEIDSLLAQEKEENTKAGEAYNSFDMAVETYIGSGMTKEQAESYWGTRYNAIASYLGIKLPASGMGSAVKDKTPITREEAARIVYELADKVNKEKIQTVKGIHNIINDFEFTATVDGVDTIYATAVEKCYSAGLLAGDNEGNFRPKASLTRAEACAIISRLSDTNRRLATPVVPEDKQEWVNHYTERDITYNNPVTGETEVKDINEWNRIDGAGCPNYNGTKDGEYSKDGYWKWDAQNPFGPGWIFAIAY